MSERRTTAEDDGKNADTRAVPSFDGLDITVEQARDLSRREFRRLFGVESLDKVPIVGDGYLERAPKDAPWYLRFRKADADRKRDVFELVVKRKGSVNPKRYSLESEVSDPDGARLEALLRLAREAGRRRRGSSWSVEEIEDLRLTDLLERYKITDLAQPAEETPKARHKRKADIAYLSAVQRAFPELCLGDIGDRIAKDYKERSDRAHTTRHTDLKKAKHAINTVLRELGVRDYKVDFAIPQPPRLAKILWAPAEYDRIKKSAEGLMFNADGSPKMIFDRDGRLVQLRRPDRTVRARKAWVRAIPFLAKTGSRGGRLPPTTWTDPGGPWIDVSDDEEVIFFRNGWLGPQDSFKRAKPVILPPDLASEVRGWFAEDIAAGIDHPFHKTNGGRYESDRLNRKMFIQILEDAGMPSDRVPHNLKDLCVEIASASGVSRHGVAVHLATRQDTVEAVYGAEVDWITLRAAAHSISEDAWRAKFEKLEDLRRRVEDGRLKSGRTRPPSGRRAKGSPTSAAA